jgi:hypothetical protein
MRDDLMTIVNKIDGSVIVGHNINADLQQVGLRSPRTFDTQNLGAIRHSSNRTHDPVEDARQSMEIAVSFMIIYFLLYHF